MVKNTTDLVSLTKNLGSSGLSDTPSLRDHKVCLITYLLFVFNIISNIKHFFKSQQRCSFCRKLAKLKDSGCCRANQVKNKMNL